MRFLDLGMASLFAFAAALQYNDPDPIRWIAVYGAACVLSLLSAAARRILPATVLTVGLVALVWALWIALGGPAVSEYSHMFDAWEMKSPSVEAAREASGLILVAAWMAVLLVRKYRRPPVHA